MVGPINMPLTQTAIIAGPDREYKVSHDHSTPELEPDSVIIKVAAVALNPVDAKLSGDFVTPGVGFGFDCAGTVIAIGSGVKKNLRIGDRICGAAGGMDKFRPFGGAFAQYTALLGHMSMRIPDGMSFEDAATMGTAINSAAGALFSSMKFSWTLLERPSHTAIPVLVYGGSTTVGTMTIQMLKLCGLKPLATCSPKNFALVKSYGAEEVWDYHSPTCGQDIRAYCKNTLAYAVDCITEESSMKICYEAIGRAGGRYVGMDPLPPNLAVMRKAVKPDWILAFHITGRPCTWPPPFESPADPEVLTWSVPMIELLEQLLKEGKLRTHPARVSKGLEAIIEGKQMLKRREVSAQKLVYTVA